MTKKSEIPDWVWEVVKERFKKLPKNIRLVIVGKRD